MKLKRGDYVKLYSGYSYIVAKVAGFNSFDENVIIINPLSTNFMLHVYIDRLRKIQQ